MSTPIPTLKSTTKSSKAAAKSKLITIRLPSTFLARFPISQAAAALDVKTIVADLASPAPTSTAHNIKSDTSTPIPTTSNSDGQAPTPAPPAQAGTPTPTTTAPKRKGPAPGSKRSAPNGEPKARAKPGPKRKKNADDINSPFGGPVTGVTGSRLGPKANQGAINAGLRALDRSGKPCRKWERKTCMVKSFTGSGWTLPQWAGLKNAPNAAFQGEVRSDSSSSDAKAASGQESNPSQSGLQPQAQYGLTTGMASSPAIDVTMQD